MIRQAVKNDAAVLASLACRLWPNHEAYEMESEFAGLMEDPEAACFIAYEQTCAIGFAQCQLRRDYVEGTQTSPVGYLEGIYVSDRYRSRGIARDLLTACENWAKGKGCAEFASDCELSNTQSLQFHLSVGFEEANRIICFTKKL